MAEIRFEPAKCGLGYNQEDLVDEGRREGKGQVEDNKFHSVMSN